MGDSPRYRPRSAYAQPGEIDTSLVEAESPRPRPAAEPNLNRPTPTPLSSIPESRPTASRPVAERERKGLGSARAAESRPSPLRPNPPTNPFYKGLASAPGLVEGKPAAFRVGTDTGLSHGNPALQRGLAPPPGTASRPSVPLRPVDIHTLIFERKHVPPPSLHPELKPVSENPEPLKTTTLSPPRSPQVRQGVSARFELLPDAKPRWNQVGLSAAGQLVILGLALLSPTIFPQTMKTALKFDVIELMQPVTEIPVASETPKPPAPRPPPKPKPKPRVEPEMPELKLEVPEPPPLVLPQLSPKQPHVFLNLKPLVPTAHTVEEKPPELKQNLKQLEIVLSSSGPKAPKEEVKPNPGASNPAPDTVNAALSKVQTGGFGDPNGIAGPGNPNRRGNINHAGSAGLPEGPGYGNGTGGAQGLRGTVASDGSGWSAAALSAAPPTIRYKPNPAYSAEGLERKIQGDVVLEVIFLASGQIKVTRVVSGLDFGMDDEAIHAAQRIRFTPAMLDGKPVDFSARIRIEFRLVRVENPSELPR